MMQTSYLNKGVLQPAELQAQTITVDGIPMLRRDTPDAQREAVEQYCRATFGPGTLMRKGENMWLWAKHNDS